MDKRYAIFDMDGTLVDSMGYWRGLAHEFLQSKGVADIPGDILKRIKSMTVTESAAMFIEEFGLEGTPYTVAEEMNAMMGRHYMTDVPLKEGVDKYLASLNDGGIRMCVASATALPLMEGCLKRLGISQYFDFLLSCEDMGIGKDRPEIYYAAAERLGAQPQDIAVYEDAVYAARTAKAAGFYLIGVYDSVSAYRWEEMKALADETVESWR